MRVVIPQIAWNTSDPVLTLDFDPNGKSVHGYYRLATGGADKLLLIWHLNNSNPADPKLHCVSELTRHQKGINVCRFSPCGSFLAAGDDDAYVFIWKLESQTEKQEVWNVEKIFRRHVEDVSDLSWSTDGNYLVSGSVDNTAVLWDVKKGTALHFWSEREHTGFVQGVAYDPLGEFCATMCIDRHLRCFNTKTGKIQSKALKYPPAWLGTMDEDGKEKASDSEKENSKSDGKTTSQSSTSTQNSNADEKTQPQGSSENSKADEGTLSQSSNQSQDDMPLTEVNISENTVPPVKKPMTTLNRLFHDDTLKTFCRRLHFSPRGEFLVVPGGLVPPVEKKVASSRQSTPVNGEDDENSKDKPSKKYDPELNNAVIVFCRNSYTNPCAVIPTGATYSIAARFNPIYYQRARNEFKYDDDFANSTVKNILMTSCVGKVRVPTKEEHFLLDMPYRLVYAVATNNNILINDTASEIPLACVKNLHCTRLTDISWSPDGLILVASSTDGYCSIITFEHGELGEEFKVLEGEEWPALTPNCFTIAPPEPKPEKKKEPKEVKEKPVKKTEEEKEATKAKPKKEKAPATPTPENKTEELKKKPTTLQKMLSGTPTTPSGSSPQRLKQDTSKLTSPTRSVAPPVASSTSPSSVANSPALNTPPVTPKPTMLDQWVKKTPISSTSQKKEPRRIALTTLASSSSTSTSSPKVASTSSSNQSLPSVSQPTSENPTASSSSSSSSLVASSPTQSNIKKPRRIQPILITDKTKVEKSEQKSQDATTSTNGTMTANEEVPTSTVKSEPEPKVLKLE